ncbi:MAG: cell division protein FtsW [Pelagibacteraceae bacterium TMED287]|nr:MAG: cell division protein FtsW [Pelagibacteraceae bacterium TMED287]|tara:strand:+ start:906 stop:2039 length:1134 start_codon:yes stop_codon:yes gene_type:complete
MQKNSFNEKLNSYWRNIDKKILLSFILLFLLGLFFSFSSTSSLAGERLNKDYYFFFSKHFLFVILSLFVMFFISFLDLKILKKSIIPLFLILFSALLIVPFVGEEIKGSKRWLDLYFFNLQPVELIKPFFIMITAKILTMEESKKNTIKSYLFSFLILLSIIILLVNQPDIGQSILLIGTWISIVFISGISLIYIISFFSFSALSLIGLVFSFPDKFSYIINRLQTFFDPSKGDTFQSQKALDAIKQGGLKGQGMGEGILKDSVPEAHTDYIIAVVAEEFGSIVSIFLVLIFLYIAFNIIKFTVTESDKNLKISLSGFSSLLIFQMFIHIGVNTSLLPTTGMTLPFLSYGGSSLIGSSILAGLILNFTKNRFINETI